MRAAIFHILFPLLRAPVRGSLASVFDKLNLKSQRQILVLAAPSSFEPELRTLSGISILRDAGKAKSIEFAIAFVTGRSEVDAAVKQIVPKTDGDVVLWFAYPKGTSKRHASEINRDTGWESLLSAGFETVRLVAIDEDWSALRFRRTAYVGGKKPR
jgi:phage protein D